MVLVVVSGVTLLTGTTTLAGQVGEDVGAAPYLESGHWTVEALRRLDALGLLGHAYDRGGWTADRHQAARLLELALERSGDDAALTATIRAYLNRLRDELPGAGVAGAGFRRGEVEAGVAYRHAEGEMLTAVGWPPDVDGWPPEPRMLPEALALERTPALFVDGSGYWGKSWTVRAQGSLSSDRFEFGEAYVRWDGGLPSLWVGRRQLRSGVGDGGVTLSGRRLLEGGGLEVDRFRLPWLLRHLGPTRFQTALTRLGEVAPYDNPLLWSMRGSIQPHPRVTMALNRAVMVPGPDQMTAEWLVQFPLVLIGKHPDGELNRQDNQIASVELAYSAPLPLLPMMLYLEWGFEDSAGAWRSVPGIVAGAYIPRVPGASWLSLGLEHASFTESCCGNPWWYRHRGFEGGWSDQRRPLAHPLGGHGRQSSLRLDVEGWDATLLGGVVVYRRDRGIENLYAPTRQGTSTGGSARTSVLLTPRFTLRTDVEHEWGDGWQRIVVRLAGGLRF